MVELQKGPLPSVLEHSGATWTQEFEALRRGEDGIPAAAERRYAHHEIKESLRVETQRKCAYCEAKIEHVAYSHIEHIFPKSRRPDLVCAWDNLTLACELCNGSKGDYYEPTCCLVDPYRDDVREHLLFAGPLVAHRSVERGRVTVAQLELNRPELMARRKEALENVQRVMDLRKSLPEGPVAEALEQELEGLIGDEAEYSATTRAFVEACSDDE